jgi:hypothetical protein
MVPVVAGLVGKIRQANAVELGDSTALSGRWEGMSKKTPRPKVVGSATLTVYVLLLVVPSH